MLKRETVFMSLRLSVKCNVNSVSTKGIIVEGVAAVAVLWLQTTALIAAFWLFSQNIISTLFSKWTLTFFSLCDPNTLSYSMHWYLWEMFPAPCHEDLNQFWMKKGVQPGISKVYLLKYPVSVFKPSTQVAPFVTCFIYIHCLVFSIKHVIYRW